MIDNGGADLTPTLRTAITLLEAGQPDQAVSSAHFHADKMMRLHGVDSEQVLEALKEHGWVLWWTGEQDRSITKFKQACSLAEKISTPEIHLTLVTQLALLIAQTGQIEPARKELLKCCNLKIPPEDQCRLFYHLAQFSLYLGDIESAEKQITKSKSAVESLRKGFYWRSAALHAEIQKTISTSTKAFTSLGEINAEQLEELVSAVIIRAPESDPVILLEVLEDLRVFLESSPQASMVQKLRTDSEIANLLGTLERHDDRISVIKSQIDYFSTATTLDKIQMKLAIALAHAEGFDLSNSLETYLQCIRELDSLADPELSFQAMFQFSMLLDQVQKFPEALHWLRLATEQAFKTDDLVGTLRAKGITGIVYLHQGKSDQALPYLREALERLSPSDPYAANVMKHWESFQAGQKCNCFNTAEINKQKVRKQIMSKSPRGYLRNVQISNENNTWKIDFDFARFPSAEMLRKIQTLSQEAKEKYLD